MQDRELTKEEIKRLLTKEDVLNLPNDTEIMVKWNGGGGPKKYKICKNKINSFQEEPYVYFWEDDKTYVLMSLNNIGKEKNNDWAYLPFCFDCYVYFLVDEQPCFGDFEFCRCPRCNYFCKCEDYFLTKERKKLIKKIT